MGWNQRARAHNRHRNFRSFTLWNGAAQRVQHVWQSTKGSREIVYLMEMEQSFHII